MNKSYSTKHQVFFILYAWSLATQIYISRMITSSVEYEVQRNNCWKYRKMEIKLILINGCASHARGNCKRL